MASDLSTLIQEGICTTINGLIAKSAVLKETTKAIKDDMENINLLKVESSFEFDNITSNWSFFIPAYTASYIFNMMLGDESEPQLEIDEDIADAMREFISNLSGGLTTAINGENFEDLGQSKFVVGNSESIRSETLEEDIFENMYKFSIGLEGRDILLFIKYDEIILPFLSLISSSKESIINEVEESQNKEEEQEKNTEQSLEELENSLHEEEAAQESTKEMETEDKEEARQSIKEGQEGKTSNNKKLKLIVMVVALLLGITIIASIIIYFSGAFEEPEPVKEEATKKEITNKDNVNIVQYEEKPDVDFKITDINKERLNPRLATLTKYEILDEEEIQAQEAAEKERLYQLQKEQELIEFAAKNKEEDIFTKKDKDPTRNIDIKTKFDKAGIPDEKNTQEVAQKIPQNNITVEDIASGKEEIKKETAKEEVQEPKDDKLKFVLVESLKYKLYNQLISQITTQNARISICKNEEGRTTVYIGPFNNIQEQNMMMELIKKENISGAKPAQITAAEFDARCSFE